MHPGTGGIDGASLARTGPGAKDLVIVDGCDTDCGRFDGDWSPSGSRLVYASGGDDNAQDVIVTSRADGTERRVVFDRYVVAYSPAWSPSGKRIAFIHWRVSTNRVRIAVMHRDGSHVRLIRVAGVREQTLDWSSRGLLTFSSDHAAPRHDEIYTMQPGGTKVRRLTHNHSSDDDPDWAPNGLRLTYVHGNTIWTMRADGSDKTSLGVRGSGPTWAPDGSLIAYIGRADGAIHTVRPDGTEDNTLGSPVPVGEILGLDWRPRP